ncbi:uncharacterized protein LOC6566392 [Drosophila grimshawi]|uniref:GH13601 n=1 Tax=Drosophila grimshawi TaxID=7222 RepID=B4JPX5_DROGR|nr:uncharacterized protein LOC6566392 [Drosophila grimshawi]EDV98955.1 GH13601 [Drosophila grimshawi]
MNLDKIPEVDMLLVTKSARLHRRAVLGFVPRIGLPIVDYADVDRIDAFYLQCQEYRDYYRDPYDRVHKPLKFTQHMGKCGIKLDTTVDELRQPINWVPRRQPLIAPIDYQSYMNLGVPMGEIFRGKYSKQSCIRYKR